MNLAAHSAPSALPAIAPAPSWAELVAHRGYLVRFAQRRLHDPMLAEDVVHDVFEAVLCGRASFGGRAALRSWLTAVLKHKIVDLVRQRAGHDSLDAQWLDEDGEAMGRPRSSARSRGPTRWPSNGSSSRGCWRASRRCPRGCAT